MEPSDRVTASASAAGMVGSPSITRESSFRAVADSPDLARCFSDPCALRPECRPGSDERPDPGRRRCAPGRGGDVARAGGIPQETRERPRLLHRRRSCCSSRSTSSEGWVEAIDQVDQPVLGARSNSRTPRGCTGPGGASRSSLWSISSPRTSETSGLRPRFSICSRSCSSSCRSTRSCRSKPRRRRAGAG